MGCCIGLQSGATRLGRVFAAGLVAWALQVGGMGCLDPIPTAAAAEAPPSVAVERSGSRVRVTFNGTLEACDGLGEIWTLLTNAVSPLEVELSGVQQFFRARRSPVEGVFDSTGVVTLTIAGPLQTHFDLALAGVPDGIFPPARPKPYFDGKVQLAQFEVPVEIRVRGNSSLQECPFPKLKFKVSREDRVGTPFAEAREIKVGTHCAEGGEGTIGRLRDERAAYREALAYEVMRELAFEGPRVRRAQIEYRDTSPASGAASAGWALSRKAFLLEDIEVVAERLGGRALSDQEAADLNDAGFGKELVVALQLLHALLGNWDYTLSPDGTEVWNTEVIAFPDGRYLPVAGDFDLASWVTEVVRASAPWDYHPELGEVEREVRWRVAELRRSAGPELFAAASERFWSRRGAIEARVAAAETDEDGRPNALRHVASFYDALGNTD